MAFRTSHTGRSPGGARLRSWRALALGYGAAALGGAAVVGGVGAVGGMGGCSPYRAPAMGIQAIKLTDEGPEGVVLQFDLEATNPNEVPLPMREARYRLELSPGDDWAGRASFSGVRSPEATLRARGTQRIILPAAVPMEPGAERPVGLVPYRFSATLVYITPGAFAETLFDTGVRRPSVTFSQSGFIDFGSEAAPAPLSPPIPPTVDPGALGER